MFLGDEICCHNSSCWHDQLYPISAKLRKLLGPQAILCACLMTSRSAGIRAPFIAMLLLLQMRTSAVIRSRVVERRTATKSARRSTRSLRTLTGSQSMCTKASPRTTRTEPLRQRRPKTTLRRFCSRRWHRTRALSSCLERFAHSLLLQHRTPHRYIEQGPSQNHCKQCRPIASSVVGSSRARIRATCRCRCRASLWLQS